MNVGTYHDIMRGEFQDRGGFTPHLAELDPTHPPNVTANLEREHDWVLLLFARSLSLRRAAETVAERLGAEDWDWGSVESLTRHRRWAMAMWLASGHCPDRASVGYLTMEGALEMLATLAV